MSVWTIVEVGTVERFGGAFLPVIAVALDEGLFASTESSAFVLVLL